jgi:hypothetical protein
MTRWARISTVITSVVIVWLSERIPSIAQTTTSPLQIQFETGGFASTNQVTPFWLRANQYGVVPLKTPLATFQISLSKDYRPIDTTRNRANRLDWGFAVNPITNVGNSNQFLLPEAYVKLKYGAVEFYAGRRRELIGLGDSLLSSGFIIGSGNAIPIPKVQIATLGYIPLKFLKRFVAIKAGYAHGWFADTYVRGSYLHQKYVYLRFGKPKSTLKVHIGMNHQVQWGGQADYLRGTPLALDGHLPSSFKYYGNVILANRPSDFENADYTDFDGSYRIGNHVGGHDFALEITTQRETMLIYYQHPFDDVSGLLFQNLPDGLIGFSWRRHPDNPTALFRVSRFVAEFLSTMDQSGPTFWIPNSTFQGADNYFNHSQYWQGWSYKGRSIGTPFIAPEGELKPELTQSAGAFFPDNRVQMGYLGAEGWFTNRLHWIARLAYSRHYGTYANPFNAGLEQISLLLSAQTSLFKSGKTQLRTSFALDQGQVYPETIGGSISLLHKLK